MSHYVLIKRINVQNANAIAGLTYGFPAITNFLGFAHALSRKLPGNLNLNFGGVAVVSHSHDIHARQPKGWGDYVFALSRNPLTHQGKTAPINEEGRMNMQISLLIELNGFLAGDSMTETALTEFIMDAVPQLRLAGGQILSVENISLLIDESEQKNALRRLMPGFVLRDRNEYLAEHYATMKQSSDDASLFDAWCDFSKLKYKAHPIDNEKETIDDASKAIKANWKPVPKPGGKGGYLVPITCGFCAISPVYDAGSVANTRDKNTPVVFAEAAYSVGEWQSVHRLNDINEAIWRYEVQYPWYLAKSQPFEASIPKPDTHETFDPDFL